MTPVSKESASIKGLFFLNTPIYQDSRGYFNEVWRDTCFDLKFVQSNESFSVEGTLRGLHFHKNQHDLWRVSKGRLFCAFVDLRQEAPIVQTLFLPEPKPRWEMNLSILIPPGVAHGFMAVEDSKLNYMVTQYYNPDDEYGVAYDDPALNIEWPKLEALFISERDKNNPTIQAIKEQNLI